MHGFKVQKEATTVYPDTIGRELTRPSTRTPHAGKRWRGEASACVLLLLT